MDYTCIYANINADTEEKTLRGDMRKILYDGVEIEIHIGMKFLLYIFADNTDTIIEFIKKSIIVKNNQ